MRLFIFLRKFLSFGHIVFLLSFVTLFAIQFKNFAGDPGLGWHLETGRWILENREIPRIDPFLATDTPRPWISDQWLSDVIFYKLYELGSWPLLYNLFGAIYILTFFYLLLPAGKKFSGSFLAAAIATFFAFKISQIHFILRPVMLSFPIFAITAISLLSYVRDNKAAVPWCLVPIFLLWANLHPSFVIGLFLVTLVVLSKFIDQFFDRDSTTFNWAEIKSAILPPLLLFLALLLVTFINPYGIHLHLSILDLGQSTFFMNLNEEWASPNFDEPSGKLFISIIGYILLGYVLAGKTEGPSKWRTYEFLILVSFSIFSLQAIRFFPYFSIVVLPLLTEALVMIGSSAIFKNYTAFSRAKKIFSSIESKERYWPHLVLTLSLVVLLWGGYRKEVPLFKEAIGPSKERFPDEALKVLEAQAPSGSDIIVFAPPNWGGYITFIGQGRFKPIIDDRNTLLGEEIYKDFLSSMRPGKRWREFAERNNANYLLLPPYSANMCDIKNSGIEVLYQDEFSLLAKL